MWAGYGEGQRKGKGQVIFKSPSGITKSSNIYDIDLSIEPRKRQKMHIESLEIPESGIYSFIVQYQLEGEDTWQNVAKIPLEIIVNLNPKELK